MSELWLPSADTLWLNAIGIVPLAIMIAGITRFFPCRPVTKHTLWLTTLLWLVAPPLLPSLSIREPEPMLAEAGSKDLPDATQAEAAPDHDPSDGANNRGRHEAVEPSRVAPSVDRPK